MANVNRINQILKEMNIKFDSIICTAGGYIKGNIKSRSVFNQMDDMYRKNVWPAILSGHLAAKHLGQNGMLLLTGAESIFK